MQALNIDTESWEDLADDCTRWRSTLDQQLKTGEGKQMNTAAENRERRKERNNSNKSESTHTCDLCNTDCLSRIRFFSNKRRCSSRTGSLNLDEFHGPMPALSLLLKTKAPVLLTSGLFFTGNMIILSSALPYVMYAMCRDRLSNATVHDCLNINEDPDLLQVVEGDATLVLMLLQMGSTLPALVLPALLGPWSDRHGRRVPMLLPFLGCGLAALLQLVMHLVAQPPLMPWLAVSLTLRAVSGHGIMVNHMATSHISDLLATAPASAKSRPPRHGEGAGEEEEAASCDCRGLDEKSGQEAPLTLHPAGGQQHTGYGTVAETKVDSVLFVPASNGHVASNGVNLTECLLTRSPESLYWKRIIRNPVGVDMDTDFNEDIDKYVDANIAVDGNSKHSAEDKGSDGGMTMQDTVSPADNTKGGGSENIAKAEEQRFMTDMCYLQLSTSVGSAAGGALCWLCERASGPGLAFAAGALLMAMGMVVVLLCLDDPVAHRRPSEDATSPRHTPLSWLRQMTGSLCQWRRLEVDPVVLWGCTLTAFLVRALQDGRNTVTVPFVQRPPLSWPRRRYAAYHAVMSSSQSLVLLLLASRLSDRSMLAFSLLCSALGSAGIAFASNTWNMMVAGCLSHLAICALISLSSLLRKAVQPHQLGQAMAKLSMAEAVSSLAGPMAVVMLYRHTLDLFPGTAFLATSVIPLLLLVAALLLNLLYRPSGQRRRHRHCHCCCC